MNPRRLRTFFVFAEDLPVANGRDLLEARQKLNEEGKFTYLPFFFSFPQISFDLSTSINLCVPQREVSAQEPQMNPFTEWFGLSSPIEPGTSHR